MSIRTPPATLANPNIATLSSGTLLHRVHDRSYAASDFNPCKGAPTRFAPIADQNGTCIPSLYSASTLEAAIYETIFHEIPVRAKRKTVPRTFVQTRAHGQLQVLCDLRLVSLRGPDLRQWRISRSSLNATSPKLYPGTTRWPSAIHHQFPNVHGLMWTSHQCDPDTSFLFFGDRVASQDFRIMRARDGLGDPTFLSDVRQAGLRSGIIIAV